MKRTQALVAVLVTLTAVSGVWAAAEQGTSLRETALRKVVDQAVRSLKASEKVSKGQKVCLVPLVRDKDGRITRALETGLVKTDKLTVVAATEVIRKLIVPEINKSQEPDLAGLMDKDEIKSAFKTFNALMIGWVEKDVVSADGAVLRINLKLVMSETAQLVWADDIASRVIAPPPPIDWRKVIGGLLLCAAALLLAVVVIKRGRAARAKVPAADGLKKSQTLCDRMARELKMARSFLADAQEKAGQAGQAELVKSIHDAEEKVTRLTDDVSNSPAGDPRSFRDDPERVRRLLAHDGVLEEHMSYVTSLAGKVKDAAGDADACRESLTLLVERVDSLRRDLDARQNIVQG